MDTLFWIIVIAVIVIGGIYLTQSRGASTKAALADAEAEAKRWTERLGGQVFALDPKGDPAATQAIADASERHTAAVAQIERATTVQQYRLAQQTAYEGLYYIAAARKTLGLDPGPELPAIPGQARAGAVTERREVEVGGESYEASPTPTDRSRYYYPGGNVAGRPVPQGWYSQPWWKPALVAGAWGVGSFLLMNAMFSGMAGTAYQDGFEAGLAEGGADGGADGGDAGGEGADAGDGGGDYGDTGGDYGDAGGDFSGGGFGDFGGGDFGGGDF